MYTTSPLTDLSLNMPQRFDGSKDVDAPTASGSVRGMPRIAVFIVFVFGAPGAGKTALCETIAEQMPEVAYVSGRRMLHDAAVRETTLIGKELRALLIEAGEDPDAVKKVRHARRTARAKAQRRRQRMADALAKAGKSKHYADRYFGTGAEFDPGEDDALGEFPEHVIVPPRLKCEVLTNCIEFYVRQQRRHVILVDDFLRNFDDVKCFRNHFGPNTDSMTCMFLNTSEDFCMRRLLESSRLRKFRFPDTTAISVTKISSRLSMYRQRIKAVEQIVMGESSTLEIDGTQQTDVILQKVCDGLRVFNHQLCLEVRRSISDGKQIIINVAERQAPYAYAVLSEQSVPWQKLKLREEEVNLSLSRQDDTSGTATQEETTIRNASVYVCMVTGPPGAGKTAVLARLVSEYDFIRLDVAQLLREEAKRDTELGSLIRRSTAAHGGNVFAVLPEVRVRTLVVTMNGYLDAGKRSFLLENFPQSTQDILVWRKALKVDGKVPALPGLATGKGDIGDGDTATVAKSSTAAPPGEKGGEGDGGDGDGALRSIRDAKKCKFDPLVVNFVCRDVEVRRARLKARGKAWDTE